MYLLFQVRNIDMPMIMRRQRLLETSSFERPFSVALEQAGLTENPIHSASTTCHHVGIEHHVRQASEKSSSRIFLNTHPAEVITDRLINSLYDLRGDFPSALISIEIHESGVTDPERMRGFMAILDELDMQLSYDDFGAGQGRLLELAEVPPNVLKFDMQLIRNIDSASASRQDLLSSLVKIAHELGTTTLAEGVETEAEHEACHQMGFEFGQGFLYGRPSAWRQAQDL